VILVTGATGFVGRHIVRTLRESGRDVRCLVRDPARASELEALGCEIVQGDMADEASLERAVAGCDRVVHLVAIIAGRPEDFERVMSDGTRSLVAAARDAGVGRFIHMSALGVSEETKDLVPYYRAKWAMEQAVIGSGLEYVIFRPSFVFGPGGGAITEFVRLVRFLPAVPVVGAGEQRIQPIFIDDVAACVDRAIDLPGVANRTFELGGPEVVSWNELWERIARTLGKRRRLVHLPVGLLRAQAAVMEKLPKPLVTRDQLTMLEVGDNTCEIATAVETFGVELTPLDEQLRRSV
jgi:NADH dehydrogenase